MGTGVRVRTRRLASALTQLGLTLSLVIGQPGYLAAAHVPAIRATAPEPAAPTTSAIDEHVEGEPFTAEEIELLVGPVALYPDELLGIVLPASTYPLQIVQAARFLEKHEADSSLKPDEAWDESVLGLLNYPEVVELMNNDLNWTWQLGEVVANQEQDVMTAVQRFRGKAHDAGNLVTNEQMVIEEQEEDGEDVIVIQSASPEVIYVPVYQPATVVVQYSYPYPWYYSPPYPYYYHRSAAFWTGVWVGAAVAYGCRWGGYGNNSVTINRNVNVNVDRPGNGNRPGGGDRPSTRPSTGQDWKADKNRGTQSGGRPGTAATRPSTGGRDVAGTRPAQAGATNRTGTRPAQAGTTDRAGARPSQGAANRPSQGTADRSGSPDRARSGTTAQPSRSHTSSSSRSSGSFGTYESRGASRQQSSRGSMSRGGGGHRGGGGGRGRR